MTQVRPPGERPEDGMIGLSHDVRVQDCRKTSLVHIAAKLTDSSNKMLFDYTSP